jgi:kumamolisin
MTPNQKTSILQESAIPAPLLRTPVGALDPGLALRVALQMIPQCGETALFDRVYKLGAQALADRVHLSPQSLDPDIAPPAAAIAAVRTFCAEHGFVLERTALAGLFITITGQAANLARAFGVELASYSHEGHTFRGYTGCVTLPALLAPHVRAVLGLDQAAWAATRRSQASTEASTEAEPPSVDNILPNVVASDYYQYPSQWTGKGATVAFIESDLAIDEDDILAFYASVPVGPAKIVQVQGLKPLQPPGGWLPLGPPLDGEAIMDLKLTGAAAPGATLVVYGQSEQYGYSSDGWIDALVAALDKLDYPCQVMSISLGGPEYSWPTQTALAVHLIFGIACLCGVTVCVSSGDYGAPGKLGPGAYQQNCAFPASSPFCLACGGTELVLEAQSAPNPPKLTGEVVWNEMTAAGDKRATGGGISLMFDVPEFQQGLSLPAPLNDGQPPGRGLPDVAANAATKSGYGLTPKHTGDYFGTSAAAPMWAALIALLVQGNGGRAIGYLNPWLYAAQIYEHQSCCTPITEGANGPPGDSISFPAGAPWNACCGLGSPLGIHIAAALGLMAARK